MSLPWNFKGRSSWFKKLQLYLKIYDFCEIWGNFVKTWYFVNNWLKFENSFYTYVTHIIVIICRSPRFASTQSTFS